MNDIKTFKKGFKFRIYPNEQQIILLNKTFGSVRYVWNKMLSDSIKEYDEYLLHKESNINNIKIIKPNLSGFEFCKKLTILKKDPELNWLNDVSSKVLQQTMLHLGTAFTMFFKKHSKHPVYRRKLNRQSFSLISGSFKIKDKELILSKCDTPLKIKWSRELPSIPSSATISRTPTGKYYISFTCEYIPVKTNGIGIIGIDLGLKDFAILSTTDKIANPKYLKYKEKQLKRLQQALSRKNKGSKNRNKARLKVAKIHEKIVNLRDDFLHKLSTRLINENQVIGIEKLKVKNMVKNHKLAKAINDVSWSKFCFMLKYKAKESNCCSVVYMSQWYPSTHICSACNIKLDHKLKLSDRTWQCPNCQTIHDRDINAAKNIYNETIKIVEELKINNKTCEFIVK